MVTAGIASLPERELSLEKTIDSIYYQVDKIVVGLNNYKKVPWFLNRKKIECYLLDNETGDGAKFYDVNNCKGYYLSIDDDLIYPADYVRTLKKAIDKYQCICTFHGRSFKFPIHSYYKSAIKRLYCLHKVKNNEYVQFGGTGVMGFHTDHINVRYSDFALPNMADIWMGKIAKDQEVKIMCLKHNDNWIEYQPQKETIYDLHNNNDQMQTNIVNEFWK